MKVYLNDEKISVDLRLLYDILKGLKALCGSICLCAKSIDRSYLDITEIW